MRTRSARAHILAALPVLAALGLACAADPGPIQNRELLGAWRWVESYGGIAGVSADPESEGYDLTLYFRRDGTLDIYVDGRLETRSPVTVNATDLRGDDSDNRLTLRYGEPITALPYVVSAESHTVRTTVPDTMTLEDPCCHRFEHVFAR